MLYAILLDIKELFVSLKVAFSKEWLNKLNLADVTKFI